MAHSTPGSEREHLHDAFDEDIQTTKALVNHASVAFALGVLTLACSVVTVMFAKLTLGFVDEDGEPYRAWAAAYVFAGIFVVSIILLLGLVLREKQMDFLRPVVLLRGDYCVLSKVNKIFVDPGATALDLKQEGGKEQVLTHLMKIKIAYQTKGTSADHPAAQHSIQDQDNSFSMSAYLDPKYKAAKLLNWVPDRVGMYVITYYVSDEKRNVGKASRTVIVTADADQSSTMVVPPSSPPPRLRVLERKGKKTISAVDVGQHRRDLSLDLDGGDGLAAGARPLEREDRATDKLRDSGEGELERFSFSNLPLSRGASEEDLTRMRGTIRED